MLKNIIFIICFVLACALIVCMMNALYKEADKYWSSLPQTGEKIMMDGHTITIMNYGFIGGTAKVRYEDGRMSRILEKEILDGEKNGS